MNSRHGKGESISRPYEILSIFGKEKNDSQKNLECEISAIGGSCNGDCFGCTSSGCELCISGCIGCTGDCTGCQTRCIDCQTRCIDCQTRCIDCQTRCIDCQTRCIDCQTRCIDCQTRCIDCTTTCMQDCIHGCIDCTDCIGSCCTEGCTSCIGSCCTEGCVSCTKCTACTQFTGAVVLQSDQIHSGPKGDYYLGDKMKNICGCKDSMKKSNQCAHYASYIFNIKKSENGISGSDISTCPSDYLVGANKLYKACQKLSKVFKVRNIYGDMKGNGLVFVLNAIGEAVHVGVFISKEQKIYHYSFSLKKISNGTSIETWVTKPSLMGGNGVKCIFLERID